jgi:hypothetical protein
MLHCSLRQLSPTSVLADGAWRATNILQALFPRLKETILPNCVE